MIAFVQIMNRIAFLDYHLGRSSATPTAPAIYRHRPRLVEQRVGLRQKVFFRDIDQDRSFDVSGLKFVGTTNVYQLNRLIPFQQSIELSD